MADINAVPPYAENISASNALQEAIYNELNKDYEVFDGWRHDSTYPYIVIGDETLIYDSSKSGQITRHQLHIDIWDSKNGSLRIKQITDDVINRLGTTLQLADGYCVAKFVATNIDFKRAQVGVQDFQRAYVTVTFTVLK
ncbi:DUF3168 domain-containing protein [Listeria phage LP-032]|uniref:Tail completion protein n=10 Tax=Homburgvirus TaxID=1921125 RepID=A0A6C0R1R5_9CAUD|nr:tail terminator [Listeria phage LP-110]YP_008240583.1 tail terminator [Listeria phage LP-037]YP_009044194.1 tail terminator [Listeria phage LP-026]YP_009045168.1 tail terminator [Listeria phage LP-114]AHL18902.1 DUF3168 domain-containing protein [Listeria phage LP-032]AWY07659.1 DUF3168 domain protein [Listeria phage LP-KV022]QDK04525.1 hypothetical protein FK481_0011 [Listeria phage LP-010]QDK04633.1 hypothetical protein FK482_0011 [Listeria phage LP-013]QDK04744.1 hypothetical protein 